MSLTLNGFRVDSRIERLMRRSDWPGRRTGESWLGRFSSHPNGPGIPFVQLCSIEQAKSENRGIQQRRFLSLFGHGVRDELWFRGEPNAEYPPGDFDPWQGYLIGLTDHCDSAVCVDLRPSHARIIYENVGIDRFIYATAFETIEEFVDFYHCQHGSDGEMDK